MHFQPSLPRVLVVDDDPMIAVLHGRFLEGRCQVECAFDVATALAALEKEPFAAVISDLQMPGENGLVLLAAVAERWPDTRRLLCSGAANDAVEAALATGLVHCFLPKPVTAEALSGHLADCLDRD